MALHAQLLILRAEAEVMRPPLDSRAIRHKLNRGCGLLLPVDPVKKKLVAVWILVIAEPLASRQRRAGSRKLDEGVHDGRAGLGHMHPGERQELLEPLAGGQRVQRGGQARQLRLSCQLHVPLAVPALVAMPGDLEPNGKTKALKQERHTDPLHHRSHVDAGKETGCADNPQPLEL
eukprot:CAMPEP_0197881218 /NCGR_PEP_ID=MMETSP1439-20131203/8786_1 /TAXON_ID=66791 /ORGANISM="Gonyaulax spinifera, Strain CCMP409" /LENGTH=175 /DNA_ID=CAMNT_0043500815 /DNA_START=42 /DNA_END=566 /DNA_ORIENTATION=-